MRNLIEAALKQTFNEGFLTNQDDDPIVDFDQEVLSLSDEDLLELYTWSVGFQG